VKWLITAREKSGDHRAAQSAKLRLKYLRAPTVEWFLATHADNTAAN
jgi:hypothetical protein